MLNYFEVDGQVLKSPLIDGDFSITSHPENYLVKFDSYEKYISNNDFLLIDKNIISLYNINTSKTFTIDATESNKNPDYAFKIIDFLLSNNFYKSNLLNVIGGGITQDLAAFVSKIFKRGINWRYFPTTLLSQCDSCIGGKTALNYKSYKNQIALFSSPKEVIIDFDFLSSLSKKEIESGMGEIIKLFIIGGDFYLDSLNDLDLNSRIKYSLQIKKTVIEEDEFECNLRKVLNFGHSFGHVFEALSNFEIPHGQSVLLGIYVINKIFDNNEKIDEIVKNHVDINLLNRFDTNSVFDCLKSDKKVLNDSIFFVTSPKPGVSKFRETKFDQNLKDKMNEIFTH